MNRENTDLPLSRVPSSTTTKLACCYVWDYPFEVTLSGSKEGGALSDQITCVDWRARKVTRKATVNVLKWQKYGQK